MQELTRDLCARVAMRWSLLFAALGVLTAFLILVLLQIQALVTEPVPESRSGIIIGLATLCLSAALLGRLAGRIVYLSGNELGFNLIIGTALALGCVIISVIAGSVIGMLISHQPSFVRPNALEDASVISLLIFLYALGPALMLGLLY